MQTMKYTNHDLEQEQLIGYWSKKTHGISRKDIQEHPCIDDLILLVKFKAEFWDLPSFWRAPFEHIYKSVYTSKIPLKGKQLRQLSRIATGMITWRNSRQEKQLKARKQIQALWNPNKKTGYDMTAKEPVTDQSPPWD